ncbi:MAG: hypothetical protein ABFC31_04525 [Clostridiaceae bacterium]
MLTVLTILITVMMIGCQPQVTAPETTPGTEPTPTATTAPVEPTPTLMLTETPLAETPTTVPATDEPGAMAGVKLSDVLDNVAKLQNGTAGISLKQASAAAKVLDWAEDNELTEEEIESKIASYLDSLADPEAVGAFIVNFELVSEIPQKILDGDDSTIGMVSDAGYSLEHTSYTQSKWDTFLAAYKDNLPSMYTSYADMVSFDPETGWALFDYWDMLKGNEAKQWLIDNEGYTEANAQEYVTNMSESEFIKKNNNTRLRAVDMDAVSITMMYQADGTPVDDANPVALTFSEFMNLYASHPDSVLDSYFYYLTVQSGAVKEVEQPYWP